MLSVTVQTLSKATRFPLVTLGRLATKVQYGTSALATAELIGLPVLRMNNLQPNGWDLSDLKYLDLPAKDVARYRLNAGDIVFTRTNGSRDLVGKCEVFRESGDWLFASYLIRVAIDQKQALPEFVAAFLGAGAGRAQIDQLSRQIMMSNINAQEIRSIRIPLPPRDTQTTLVKDLQAARSARDGKLGQADALLNAIDDLALAELGLIAPKKDGRFVFAVRLRELKTRCDADYHCPRFRALRKSIEAGKHSVAFVRALCRRIESGFAAGQQDQADDEADGVPHIRPLNITGRGQLTFDGTKYIPKASVKPGDMLAKGDVLFNNTNSTAWVGKTTVFPGGRTCACSNHITRLVVDDARVMPDYLAALFNVLRGLGLFGLLSTNFNNQAGINVTTLGDLRIPVPSLPTQQQIIADVTQRYADADRLRAEAAALWAKALEDFERKLVSGGAKG